MEKQTCCSPPARPGSTTRLLLMICLAGMATFSVSRAAVTNCYPQDLDYWTGTADNQGSKIQTSLVHAQGSSSGNRGWMKFDITAIPPGSTINNVVLKFYISSQYNPGYQIRKVTADPVTSSGSTLFSQIGSGTIYGTFSNVVSGQNSRTLSTQARTDLQNALGQGWFAVGFYCYNSSGIFYLWADGWNQANKPYLEITYTPGLIDDIGIDSITSPVNQSCEGQWPIQLKLFNGGNNTISSASLDWSINGVSQPSVPWMGTLAPGAVTTVTLGNFTFLPGNISIFAQAAYPNGVSDPFPGNNSKTVIIQIVPPPSITAHPTSILAIAGYPAIFTVSSLGLPFYQWQISTNNGVTWINLSNVYPYEGVNDDTLTILSPTLQMSGYKYRCEMSGCGTTVTSNSATLTVIKLVKTWIDTLYTCPCVLPYPDIVVPVKVADFDSISSVSLSLLYKAAALEYQGIQNVHSNLVGPVVSNNIQGSPFNNFRLAYYNFMGAISVPDSATLFELKFKVKCDTTRLMWETWTPGACQYATGQTTFNDVFFDGWILNGGPLVLQQPFSDTVYLGDTATFTCQGATYGASISYQWQESTDGGTTWNNLVPNTTYMDVYTQTLKVKANLVTMSGFRYRCVILGLCPAVSTNMVILTVNNPPGTLEIIATSATPATICQGQNSQLEVIATGGSGQYSYQWEPANAITGSNTVANPVANPTVTTTYSVTVFDGVISLFDTITVTVFPLPNATAGSNTPICANATLNLTSGGGVGYAWSGPAGFTSSMQNPSIPNAPVTAGGSYTVTVTSAEGCQVTTTTTAMVNPLPTPSAGSNSPICANATLNLTAGGGVGYVWLGPAGFTTLIQNPSISNAPVTAGGSYTVTVTSAEGCQNTASTTVVVNPLPTPFASSNAPFCANTPLLLTATGGTLFTWTGPEGFTSNNQNPIINNAQAINSGTYIVEVTNANSCQASTVVNVTVWPRPTAAAAVTLSPLCANQTINLIGNASGGSSSNYTFCWSGPNGFSSATQNPTLSGAIINNSGTYSLTVSDGNCNSVNSASVNVTVWPRPTAGATATPNVLCSNNPINLGGSGLGGLAPYTYAWTGPSGFTSTTQSPTIPNALPGMTGVYTLVVTDAHNCASTNNAMINITVYGQPIVSLNTFPPLCADGGPYTLTGGSPPGGTYSGPGVNANVLDPLVPGPGDITVTYSFSDTNQCTNDASQSITIEAAVAPAGIISGPDTVCQGQSAIYSVGEISGASSYIWELPPGASGQSNGNSITVAFGDEALTGYISVSGINACGQGTASQSGIHVNPLPSAPTSISGPVNVCQGQIVTYNIAPISYVQDYLWTVPPGFDVLSANSNTLQVSINTSAMSGIIRVKGTNACGVGPESSILVNVSPLPVAAGNINGPQNVCQGMVNILYGINPIPNAVSYQWTLPTGFIGTSMSSFIIVNTNNNAVSGNITVKGMNACGAGLPTSLPVSVFPLPGAAGPVSGEINPCQGSAGWYSVQPISGATSYQWTIPQGYGGNSDSCSIYLSIGENAGPGTLGVAGLNNCGSGESSAILIEPIPIPAAAAPISGPAMVCSGSQGILYETLPIAHADSYHWIFPPGVTGTEVQNTAILDFPTASTSGFITVEAENNCGTGASASLWISIADPPVADLGEDTVITPASPLLIDVEVSGGTPPFAYLWNTGSTDSLITVAPLSTTIYAVSITDQNGCTDSDSLLVSVTGGSILTITAPMLNSCPGDLAIPVSVTNLNNAASVSLYLNYQDTILEYLGYDSVNPALGGGILLVNDFLSQVQLAWFSVLPATIDSGLLLRLLFTGQTGTSSLIWDPTPGNCLITDINNQAIPSIMINGSVTVNTCSNLSGHLTYKNVISSPLNNSQVLLSKDSGNNDTCTTDGNGYYFFGNLPLGIYTVNAACGKPWGGVNAADALMILRHFVGMTTLTGLQYNAGDVDSNTSVNASDALLVARRYVHLSDSFPAGDWLFESTTLNIDGSSNISHNFQGLCYGDVDGSYLPAARQSPSLRMEYEGTIIFHSGDEISIPVRISEAARPGAVSLAFDMNCGDFAVTNVHCEHPGRLVYHQTHDQLRICWYELHGMPLLPGDVLLTIHLRILNPGKESNSPKITLATESQLSDTEAGLMQATLIMPLLLEVQDECFVGQNEPNPAEGKWHIPVWLPEKCRLIVSITDITGRMIRSYDAGSFEAGSHRLEMEQLCMPGVYLYRVDAEGESRHYFGSGKCVISKQ
ncbi:MAG TPA: hypothetical protein P5531_10365 [Bacteroidales bacterium]|nr:hypothetical protein [Bacteroidales bacterium]HSA43635.1 hypothetical protein [Bacteroidales bacterium]